MPEELDLPGDAPADIDYPADVVEKALWAAALHGGSYTKAHKVLFDQGIVVPRKTIEHWAKVTHRNRYQQIRTVEYDRLMVEIAAEMTDNAASAQEVEKRALERTLQGVDSADPLEASQILRNVSQARSSMVQQAQLLRGRPTENVNVTLTDLAKELEQLGVVQYSEPTLDVEVVDEDVGDPDAAG